MLFVNTRRGIGSVQRVHAAIARLLDRSRFAVYVATPPGCEELMGWEEAPDVTVWKVPLGTSVTDRRGAAARLAAAFANLPMLAALLWLASRVRQYRIGIIHTATTPRDALSGLVLSRLTGAKLVIHWHHVFWDWDPDAWRWDRHVWRLAFNRAHLILAVSEVSHRSLLAAGVPPRKAQVLYNGIDLEWFRPHLDGLPVRRELGIDPAAFVVLLPGRFCPPKGQADLLRAVALLKARGREVLALLVGHDDLSNTPGRRSYSAELRRLRSELGIEDQVLVTDYRSDMPLVMAAADVVAVPSYEEPFGLVVVEAMACGRPVIGALSGAIPQIVRDGVTGLLVPPGDPVALAEAIERLLADRQLRRRISEEARRDAETKYSQERMVQDAGEIYEALLHERERLVLDA